jgi:hypothetical protein
MRASQRQESGRNRIEGGTGCKAAGGATSPHDLLAGDNKLQRRREERGRRVGRQGGAARYTAAGRAAASPRRRLVVGERRQGQCQGRGAAAESSQGW